MMPVTLPRLEVNVEINDLKYGNIIAGAFVFTKFFFVCSSIWSFPNSREPTAISDKINQLTHFNSTWIKMLKIFALCDKVWKQNTNPKNLALFFWQSICIYPPDKNKKHKTNENEF